MADINMLKVKHSVDVNGLGQGECSLTLDQLWKGLILKLTHSQRFDQQIEHCHIQWLNDLQFIREQQYPELKVEDKVTLTPQSSIDVQSLVSGPEAFRLSIAIESAEQFLSVHYEYQRASANQGSLDVDHYLAEAYKQADEAAIQLIKTMVNAGEL